MELTASVKNGCVNRRERAGDQMEPKQRNDKASKTLSLVNRNGVASALGSEN